MVFSMKRVSIKYILLSFLLIIAFLFTINIKAIDKNKINIHVYTQVGCTNCHNMMEYLHELENKNDNITIIELNYDSSISSSDPKYEENKKILDGQKYFSELFEYENSGFPLTIIGNKCYLGYNNDIKVKIENDIKNFSIEEYTDIFKMYEEEIEITKDMISKDDTFNIPILGKVVAGKVSLLLASIVIGLLDGFNPCGMWVLLLILALLIQSNSKKKMIILGLAFIITSGVFYFAMMMSWMTLIRNLAGKRIFLIIVGVIALGVGGYNIYKFIKSKKENNDGCDVTSVETKRKLSKRIKDFINNKSLIIGVFGIIAITLLVNLFELACSAGYPLIFSTLLKASGVGIFREIMYTLVYVLFFVLDDLIVFIIALVTMNIKAISNKITKYANLIGGIIMIILAILMIFFPNVIANPFG